MVAKLILVVKSDGTKCNVSLELTDFLTETRAKLITKKIMTEQDDFLLNNAPIYRDDEKEVHLSDVVGETGATPLKIGTADTGLEDADASVDRYNHLTTTEKLALFEEVQIYQGISASPKNGFYRTFKPCVATWKDAQLPAAAKPKYVSDVHIVSSFTEVDHSLSKFSSDKASVSLNTPYGGGESSFNYAKSHSTSSKKVTEYLLGKYLVNKVRLQQSVENLALVPEFEKNLAAAVAASTEIDAYAKTIDTLNEWGYYVARTFTLGGVLVGEETTSIFEYKEAETQKSEFSVGFKLAIDGFGGGGDYSHSHGSESSTETTSKYTDISLTKTGGLPSAKDYSEWALSLNKSINWDVTDYEELFPTLALVSDKRLIRRCISLMDTYDTYSTVKDRQQVIDIGQYVTQVQKILNATAVTFG